MLSFIPLVLFGSLAAAAFVTDDDEDLETDTGASDDDARDAEEMVLGGADLLVEVGAALPAAAPLATAVSWDSFGDGDEDEDEDEDDDTVIVADFGGPVAPLAPADPDVDVISIEVDDDDNIFEDDLPGPEAGFRAQLGPGDELTLNIADDVTGRIAAVQAVHDTHAEDGHDILSYSLNFYLVPDDIDLPEDGYEGSETDFIETYEAQKLGELDLGRFETRTDPDSGDVEVTADSRQIEAPQVNSNRDVVILDALFA